MARVTTKREEVKYMLELSSREAEALTELLVAVDGSKGEGPTLDRVYSALVEAGCESMATAVSHPGEVVVERDSE